MFALKEGCADHFVSNWGGLRPPQPPPPRFLKAINGCKEKEQASGFMFALKEGCADHSVCNWGSGFMFALKEV